MSREFCHGNSFVLEMFGLSLLCEMALYIAVMAQNLLLNDVYRLLTSSLSSLGNFEVLETLFKLLEESPDLHADLDPQTQDAEGNTVFHVAARVSFSKHALKAVELLCAHRVNPNIRNHAHKTALECLAKRNDRRTQFIRNAGRNFAPPQSVRKEKKPVEPEGGVRVADTAVDPGVESGSVAQTKPSTTPSTSSTAKTFSVSFSV